MEQVSTAFDIGTLVREGDGGDAGIVSEVSLVGGRGCAARYRLYGHPSIGSAAKRSDWIAQDRLYALAGPSDESLRLLGDARRLDASNGPKAR